MLWSFADALNLALDLIGLDEYRGLDLDRLTTDLWHEMERENYETEMMTRKGE